MTQSPIDISETSGASVEPIEFDYHLTPLEIVHNGHTVQVNYQPGSGITVCSAPGSLDTSLSHAAGLIEIAACHA